MGALRLMHQTSPDKYSIAQLARMHGISAEAVVRILRSKFVPEPHVLARQARTRRAADRPMSAPRGNRRGSEHAGETQPLFLSDQPQRKSLFDKADTPPSPITSPPTATKASSTVKPGVSGPTALQRQYRARMPVTADIKEANNKARGTPQPVETDKLSVVGGKADEATQRRLRAFLKQHALTKQ